jgi:MFS family permease
MSKASDDASSSELTDTASELHSETTAELPAAKTDKNLWAAWKHWLIPIAVCHISIHSCMTGSRLAAPLGVLQFGGTAFEVGLLLALYSAASIVLAIPAGRFVDRNGMQLMVRMGALACTFGMACVAIRPSLLTLSVAALCAGAAATCNLVALQRYVGKVTTSANERRVAFSYVAIAPAISSLLGPTSTGFMLDYMGMRGTFVVLAVLPIIAMFAIARVPEQAYVPEPEDSNKRRAWDLLQAPGVKRLFVINILLSASWDVHTFVVPVFGHERGMSASLIGLVAGSFAVAAIMVRILLPSIAARLQERQVLGIAMVITAIAFALYPFAPNAGFMMALSALLGLVLGCVQPMIMSALHMLTPEHRHGEAVGLRLTVLNFSSAIMPLIFGGVGSAIGISVVFWMAAAALSSGLPIVRSLKIHEHQSKKTDPTST